MLKNEPCKNCGIVEWRVILLSELESFYAICEKAILARKEFEKAMRSDLKNSENITYGMEKLLESFKTFFKI